MFSQQTYSERRRRLREKVGSGLILFQGNGESPVNYPANEYPFRQDSSFLYFFGLNEPGLFGLIDVDEDRDSLYGTDRTLEDVVWMGPQPSLAERAAGAGVTESGTPEALKRKMRGALGRKRKIHFLPPYRGEQILGLGRLLGIENGAVKKQASVELIKAVVELRTFKSGAEIAEIEKALDVTHEAFAAAARAIRPGAFECEVVGVADGVLGSRGTRHAYPIILSVHGEILHNHQHQNAMKDGDLLIMDCGAESPEGYASDVTRTFPVGGKFSPEQEDLYRLVLKTQLAAIAAIRPGKPYREVHLDAAHCIASGLKDMGLMQGDMDSAVEAGAHALFFPHGLGHMLGLDVHDMEGLGEDFVGYAGKSKRSSQFGLAHLRLAKELQAGYVLTVEPGIYFIPALIDQWKSQGKCREWIDYARVEKFRKAGGIRIEDDVLVTDKGARVLGKPISKGFTRLG